MPSDPVSPRPTAPPVGNDVVDLTDPRCHGKGTDERFLRRVLAPSEREAVSAASDADLAVWRFWAAKEAAFKTATRLRDEPPVFVHADFLVEPSRPDGGRVRWGEWAFHWRVSGGRDEGGLHAVAWWDSGPGAPRVEGATERRAPTGDRSVERWLHRFTEQERRAIHSPPSAWVRLGARAHLARVMARNESGLEIVCAEGPTGRMPPLVLVDGHPSTWSVSLSHHGGLVGWVLARWPEAGETAHEIRPPPLPHGEGSPGTRP
jgi:hypothetical protein